MKKVQISSTEGGKKIAKSSKQARHNEACLGGIALGRDEMDSAFFTFLIKCRRAEFARREAIATPLDT